MSKAVVERKEELDEEVMETQAAQVQLDKAAEDFRCGMGAGEGGGRAREPRPNYVGA